MANVSIRVDDTVKRRAENICSEFNVNNLNIILPTNHNILYF
jgi:antitoxin component of RelBE/YafQ-DinJ toxin-antitoxin module